MEGLNPSTVVPADNIVQELLEEDLQREIERNTVANKIAMEREKEAMAARERAAESQRMMQEMVLKYHTMKKKLDITKKALEDTNSRIGVQERITAKLDDMKQRLADYTEKKDEADKKSMVSSMDALGSLFALKEEEEEEAKQTEAGAAREEALKEGFKEHADFVKKLQDKLVGKEEELKKRGELRERLELMVEAGEKKVQQSIEMAQKKEEMVKAKQEELDKQKTASKETGAKPKRRKSKSKSKTTSPKVMSPEPVIPQNVLSEETKEDIKETVKKIEGKCATVRGDLADMAMSEQYLRTKQALLLAKKKEKEMEVAEKMAQLREAEVAKMKEKVKQMQEMLNNRKLKLKITEDIVEKKDIQQTRIERMMDNKKKREQFMEKQVKAGTNQESEACNEACSILEKAIEKKSDEKKTKRKEKKVDREHKHTAVVEEEEKSSKDKRQPDDHKSTE